jgi:hypothetical protein
LLKTKITIHKIFRCANTKTRAKEKRSAAKAAKKRKDFPKIRRFKNMSNNSRKTLVPEAKEALNRFKMEAASEVGVNLKEGYNGDLTSKQAGSVGGQMVKKMIESYEQGMK